MPLVTVTVAITTLITLHPNPTLLNPSHHPSIHSSTQQLSLSLFQNKVHDTHPKQPNEHAN
jgi:hypothetical protein